MVPPTKWVLISAMMLVCCRAEQPDPREKPPCSAQNRGEVWPSRNARNNCTEVQLCTVKHWKYSWVPITVHVSHLPKDPRRRSTCESEQGNDVGFADRSVPETRDRP